MEQPPGVEIVAGMGQALEELLRRNREATGKLPDAMLVYRDGVSDSQLGAVVDKAGRAHEAGEVAVACAAIGGPPYAPPLTLLVVSKSHGLRMMAVTGGADVGGERLPEVDNPLPGSVLDHTVTRPLAYRYYLASHAAIQGASRPGKYQVLVVDRGLGPDTLQLVTHWLCFTHGACSRSVRQPVPARYADQAAAAAALLAKRGAWPQRQQTGGGSGGSGRAGAEQGPHYRMIPLADTLAGSHWYL
ncbi:eukaryotic translation initiation factor 2C, 4 [Monoraphidium neglectum]|uniref:Eukaryotic translation initiation factor 2C, 4 n=1 Tax=Monoraphidium neglectum TaxID=145388 RepID=A0A0D2MVX0_9CHLO|nr:eukaryotic translation initiation factor 2C, 4 [Monoraphidium neglectum]KIY98475.1 eukaryotic translation initiation factor 2C, 4 [Monoraphidium neglectum]|eukprot:XP_013897495.1 eukaryotic translation initiation factor 2C, 4 [Monoraphidium neglectum]